MAQLVRMNQGLDDIFNEQPQDEMVRSSLLKQLEDLEKVQMLLEERERDKQEIESVAEEFKRETLKNVELPDDYEEVAGRIVDQVIQEKKASRVRTAEPGDDQRPELLRSVENKLRTPLYGFAREQPAQDSSLGGLASEYARGLERIRELDRKLAQKEAEERAIKEMIRLQKVQDRQCERESRLEASNELEANPSSVSQQSSKSDFFMTQNKKTKKPLPLASKQDGLEGRQPVPVSANKRILSRGSKQGLRQPADSQPGSERLQPASTPTLDLVKRNVETVSLDEHQKFLNSMDEKSLKRYQELLTEIEDSLDSDDPDRIKRATEVHYSSIYAYPPELQERFQAIDDKIIELMAADPLCRTKPSDDVIRERREQKELKQRLKTLDQKLAALKETDLDLPAEERDRRVQAELALVDQETLTAIREGIDLTGFDELEGLEEEALKIMQAIDVDSIEHFLEDAICKVELAEAALTAEREAERASAQRELDALEDSRRQAEDYIAFLQKNQQLLDEFDFGANLSTEEDLEAYEAMVKQKLRSNVDMVDHWYQSLEAGRGELERIQLDNTLLRHELEAVPLRDPARFDELLEAELREKYPDVFRVRPPAQTGPGEDDDEEGQRDAMDAVD